MTSTTLAKPMIPAAAQTSAFTAAGGRIYPIDATSADVPATLPASARQGSAITFIRTDSSSHAATISRGGSDTITSGGGTVTSLSLSGGQGQSVTLVSDGAGHWVIAQQTPGNTSYAALGSVVVDAAAQYGVAADGTDQSTKLAAAATAVNAAGGGVILLPPGVIRAANIPVKTFLTWRGRGKGTTVVKLPDSSTGHVFKGDNFDTLTGTTPGWSGPYQWAIEDMSIDGNKASAPSGGMGVAVYGFEFSMSRLLVRNCHGNGVQLEFGGSGGSIPSTVILDESFLNDIKIDSCDGWGLYAQGVHDSVFKGVNVSRNAGGGIWANASGIWIGCHSWGFQPYAWELAGTETLIGCQGEGGTIANFYVAWKRQQILGGRCYSPGSGTAVGVKFGSGADFAVINGLSIEGFSSSSGAAVDFTNAGVNLVCKASTDQTTGSVTAGTIPTDAQVDIQSTLGHVVQVPGYAITATPTTPSTNPVITDAFLGANAAALSVTNWTVSHGSAGTNPLLNGSNQAVFTSGATGSFSVNDKSFALSTVPNSLLNFEILFSYVSKDVTHEGYCFVTGRSTTTDPQVSSSNYDVMMSQSTGGFLQVAVNKYVTGTKTVLYTSGNLRSPSVGDVQWVRFRVNGTSVQMRTWRDGVVEPTAWTYSGTDSAVSAAGSVSIAGAGGNAAVASSFAIGRFELKAL